jgi:hypothetical protein
MMLNNYEIVLSDLQQIRLPTFERVLYFSTSQSSHNQRAAPLKMALDKDRREHYSWWLR